MMGIMIIESQDDVVGANEVFAAFGLTNQNVQLVKQ